MSADASTLYFDSVRPGGLGGHDIWQASIGPVVDFGDDGTANLGDFYKLAQYWRRSEPSVDIGLSPLGDGAVDFRDLRVLATHWLEDASPPVYIQWLGHSSVKIWAENTVVYVDPRNLSEFPHDATVVCVTHSHSDHYVPADIGKVWKADTVFVAPPDGVASYISTLSILDPADGPFSVFAWVNGGAPGQVVVSQDSGDDWLMADPSVGNLMTTLQKPRGRSPVPPLICEVVITDGQWHRVGFVWDGTDRNLYVDDLEVARDTQAAPAGSTSGLYLGCGKEQEAGTFWSGLIDDVRVYGRTVKP